MKIIKNLGITVAMGMFAMSINMAFGKKFTNTEFDQLKSNVVGLDTEIREVYNPRAVWKISYKLGRCQDGDMVDANAIFLLSCLNLNPEIIERIGRNERVSLYNDLTKKKFDDCREKLEKLNESSNVPFIIDLSGFQGTIITEIATIISQNDYIYEVNLNVCNIDDSGAVALANALKVNKSLRVLKLGSNNIGDSGAVALADALKFNGSLRDLDLSYNKNIGALGAIALAVTLEVNSSLRDLNLNGIQRLKQREMNAFAKALTVNRTLLYLHLSECCDKDISCFAEVLRVNKALVYLNLSYNRVDVGISNIAEALKINNSLICLNLSGNWLDRGILELAEALKVNTSLVYLELRNNNPHDAEVGCFVDALRKNNTLVYLSLLGNPIDTKDFADVLEDKKNKNGKIIERGNSTIAVPFLEYYDCYKALKSQLGE